VRIFGRPMKRTEKVQIIRTEALLTDADAIAHLLEPLPESGELRPRLDHVFFVRAWHEQTSRDYWVSSDGERVRCFTIAGLTLRQAAAIRVRWDAMSSDRHLDEHVLSLLISSELGIRAQLVID
jgi:hypothetical protein